MNRLENIPRDGLEPRLTGIQFRLVESFEEGSVLVLRVPRRWAFPHMVTFKNLSRLYARSGAGKYQMDVAELRSAFSLSQGMADRVRGFRAERVHRIIAEDTPVTLPGGSKMVVHLVFLQLG